MQFRPITRHPARIAAGTDLPDISTLTNLGNNQKLAADGVIIVQINLIT